VQHKIYLKEFRMSKNFGLAVAAAADSEQRKEITP